MSCLFGLLFSNTHEIASKQNTYSNVRYISNRDVTTFPWKESFENPGNNADGHPDDWMQRDYDKDGERWKLFTKSANIGNNCMGSESTKNSEPLDPDNWLITPKIVMPSSNVNDFVLRFFVRNEASGALADSLMVYIAEDGTEVYDFEDTIYKGRPTELWKEVTINISKYRGKNIYVAFRHLRSSGRRIVFIDDVFIGHSSDAPEVPADFNAPYVQNFENIADIEDIKWSFKGELGAWIDWDGGVNKSGNIYLRFEEDLDAVSGYLQTPSIDSITNNMTMIFAYRAMDYYGYPTVTTPGNEIEIKITYSVDGSEFENTLLSIDNHIASLNYRYITIPLAGKGFEPEKLYRFRFEVEIIDGYPRFDLDEFIIADLYSLGSISGTVTCDYKPVPNAKLNLIDFGKIAYTDENGDYTLDNVLAGTNDITVLRHGFFYKEEKGISLNTGEEKTVDIVLTGLPTANITGKILKDGAPLEWAYVKLYEVYGFDEFMTVTDNKGEFSISVFADMDYELQAFKPGFNVYSHASEIEVAGQEISLADITLEANTGYLWEEDFESEHFPPIGWTSVDKDGDGVNWIKVKESDYDPPYNFEGNFAASQSYWEYEYFYKIFFPDNYLISPRVTLPTKIPDNKIILLSYYVVTMLESAPVETYSVLISETGTDINDFEVVRSETFTEADAHWTIKGIDLSNYAGKNIYIAFRHHDSTDQFLVGIDKIRLAVSDPLSTDDPIIPAMKTTLKANYPNPFNPTTTIEFSVGMGDKFGISSTNQGTHVTIDIFNIKGQKVKTLVNDFFKAGSHKVVWNGIDNNNKTVSSGIYFYKMESEGFTATRKMVMIK